MKTREKHRSMRRRSLLGALVVIIAAAALSGPAAAEVLSGSAAASEPVVLEVRFDGSASVRGGGDRLRAASETAENRVERLIEEVGAVSARPLVAGQTQAEATEIARDAREATGSAIPNMANWYRLTLPAGAAPAAALAELRASGLVSFAGRAPEPVPPPATPDFTAQQLYLDAAPTGTGARFAPGDERLRGAGITVVDLEYDWTDAHEDLQLPADFEMGGDSFDRYTAFADEHGTAVVGIMASLDNGLGVTGGVPGATMKGMPPIATPGGYNPAAALAYLAGRVAPGDVVLIEQQTPGPTGAFVPLEWNQPSFDAIATLSALGVLVVETGGNGGQNLDGENMLGRFDRSVRDSDAILIGAGDALTRAPLGFTSRGSRVDLQGWGHGIVTTGGDGSLQGPSAGERLTRYTQTFGGTSGAGPIVTNVVVAVQSYLRATGEELLDADEMTELLAGTATATAQSSHELGNIGPLPDLAAALVEIEVDPPTVQHALGEGVAELSADDGWGSGVDEIEYRADGGPWTIYATPVPTAGLELLEYRARDLNGNLSGVEEARLPVGPPRPPQPPQPPPTDPGPPADPQPPFVPGFSLGRAVKDRSKGLVRLAVTVEGAGRVELAGRQVRPAATQLAAAGTARLIVRPRGKAKRALARRGKVRVALRVSFTPAGGEAQARSLSVSVAGKRAARSPAHTR